MQESAEKIWEAYREQELTRLRPLLHTLGFILDDEQPHLRGERYLMQAMTTTSGRKLILLGRSGATDTRVVIKASSDVDGMKELAHERLCRTLLPTIRFAYQTFKSPAEVLYTTEAGFLISIQAFIEQERPFLSRPVEEQFGIALTAFKAQESVHAATYEHERRIGRTFGQLSAPDYLRNFATFTESILASGALGPESEALCAIAQKELTADAETIEQYSGFLTHTDFVPHNFRLVGDDLYLLDHSSLRFGNKYEGWARFTNYMTLHNPPLAQALVQYVKDNRAPEELQSFSRMRIYRLGEIISYYARTLSQSTDNLLTLNQARVNFWTCVLSTLMHGTPLSEQVLNEYRTLRDSLRSDDENKRQQSLG